MGTRHSTNAPTAAVHESPASQRQQEVPSLPDTETAAPTCMVPQWFGFPNDVLRNEHQLLSEASAAAIWASVPPMFDAADKLHPNGWGLLYHSKLHGCSFSRMIQLIADRGPTIVVIRASSGDDPALQRLFGGYNEASWLTVSQRERQARSNAAAVARARRDGVAGNVPGCRPTNQAPVYFGNEHSFLFSVPQPQTTSAPTIYRSRPGVNANYMYLFDVHPDDDRVGIGMGGVPPGQFGWFLDRWLEGGVCKGARCSTYHNPMLSATENWHVDAVEVYALGWAAVEDIRCAGGTTVDGKVTSCDKGSSVRNGPDVIVDKIILELAQAHHFYADHDPRCADESGEPQCY